MNASVHRLRIIGKDRIAVRLVEFRHTYNLHKKAAEKGETLPIAIVIGIDPVTLFAISTACLKERVQLCSRSNGCTA